MARRRRTELDLNFDSLTDLVTNLAGGFILLVLLLMGVTRPASSQNEAPSPPPPPKESNQGDLEQKSMAPLLARVNQLKAQVRGVDQEIDKVKADLPALKDEVEALIRKAEAIQPPKPVKEEGEQPVARTVPFRPPVERDADKQTGVGFVCQDGRVSIFDSAAYDREVDRVGDKFQVGENPVTVPGGDFDVIVFSLGGKQILYGKFQRKAGHVGETIDEFLKPDSRFQNLLNGIDNQKEYVQFVVYPDSFDAFRRCRDLVWSKKFDAQWSPIEAGAVITMGRGRGKVQ